MPAGCRFCSAPLEQELIDLGLSPLSNAFLEASQLEQPENRYPLRAWVCGECFLVQLEQFESPDTIFQDYFYFSSYSESWLEHARAFAVSATKRFGLNEGSRVVEIASNDGYLLQYFKADGIPVLGIEPARNVAQVAVSAGIETVMEFFGVSLARKMREQGQRCDLLVGNNVLAHVPDLNDFVTGLKILLAENGVLSMEFPHLHQMLEHTQFDTIYHEHFSYFSLLTAQQVFAKHDLEIFDVEELPTHGGSLRVYVQHHGGRQSRDPNVASLLERERAAGLEQMKTYQGFSTRVVKIKQDLLTFLQQARDDGKRVAAYGAPAKGNTLLNYCGINTELVEYTVDRSPHKQGRFLPGTHIPVLAPEHVSQSRPDYLLILPWNLRSEILSQMRQVREWGGKFVLPVPRLEIVP